MQLIQLLGLFIVSIFLLSSCGSDEIIDDNSFSTENYYNVSQGKSWTYKVDSIIYDDLGSTILNSSSFFRETVKEVVRASNSDTTFRLEIAKRKDTLEDWRITDVWTITKSAESIRKTEENLNFVKLFYQSFIGFNWEGNQFDPKTEVIIAGDAVEVYKNWDYEILSKTQMVNLELGNFDDVLEVQLAADSNSVEKRFAKEFYANGVGMILKEMEILDKFCSMDCEEEIPWFMKADQGFILRKELIDYQ